MTFTSGGNDVSEVTVDGVVQSNRRITLVDNRQDHTVTIKLVYHAE